MRVRTPQLYIINGAVAPPPFVRNYRTRLSYVTPKTIHVTTPLVDTGVIIYTALMQDGRLRRLLR